MLWRSAIIVDSLPLEATLIGYTNDPTAFLNVYHCNGELYVDELIYEQELTSSDICQRLRDYNVTRSQEIIADSAEPKSIQEICNGGFNCFAVTKGTDSVRNGINILKRYKNNITKRSTV